MGFRRQGRAISILEMLEKRLTVCVQASKLEFGNTNRLGKGIDNDANPRLLCQIVYQ